MKLTRFLLGFFLFSLLGMPLVSAGNNGSELELEAIDTISGYSALVRVENAPSACEVELILEKPDGGEVLFSVQPDRYGTAKLDIEGYYTKRAGDYGLSGQCMNRNDSSARTHFRVYPDEVSPSVSGVDMSRKTGVADGNTPVLITAYLRDRYGNPISKHNLKLIPSRISDEVVLVSNSYTDNQGKISFHVYSHEAGVASFIAYDETDNKTLNARPEIAFYEPKSYISERGGYSSVLLAASGGSGPVDHFKIEDLPETIEVGEALNFTVTAYDVDEVVATDYMGEIRFSSSDDNATLPNDYTFEAEDQGIHTFSLGLSFKTEGVQTLTVTDLDNPEIQAEIEVQVENGGSGSSVVNSDEQDTISVSEDFQIFTPLEGTYSSNTLTFSGQAPYGVTVTIYDNDVLLGKTQATANGEFTYEATTLADGNHTFVLSTEEEGEILETSDEIEVTIDTQVAAVDKVEIDPEGDIFAGDPFTITVYTEPDLSQVGVIFNNILFDLTEDPLVNGVYQATLTAPDELGEYDMDVILVDEIGNEISYEKVASLNVVTSDASESTPPGNVTGVEAVSDDSSIALSWETPADQSEDTVIDHYKVYYGPDPELMFSTAVNEDSSTHLTISQLQNGSVYYFSVVAVDENDQESVTPSEPVTAMPEADVDQLYNASIEDQAQQDLEDQANEDALNTAMDEEETPDTGPEVVWLLIFSVGLSYFYFYGRNSRRSRSSVAQFPRNC